MHRLSHAALLTSVLALGGCTVGPDFSRPPLASGAGVVRETPAPVAAAPGVPGGGAQYFVEGRDIPGQWWTLFRSPQLDRLVAEALQANPDLAAAQAALRQAREAVHADEAGLLPALGAGASATREKISGLAMGFPALSQELTVSTASLSVSYAPDVFGGTRRRIESAKAEADIQRYQLEATWLTLVANVVDTAVALASEQDQIAQTGAILEVGNEQLAVLRSQVKYGAASNVDLLAQQSAIEQTEASLPPLRKQLAETRNQLMALVGRFPAQDRGESFRLADFDLPVELPLSLPSRIVAQRPDVLAAEAGWHAASANVGVAIADQLPQFSITGQVGTIDPGVFGSGAGIWSLAGSLAQSLFDGGAAEHRKREAVAAYDGAAARYRSTVLSAFQDVANALRALQNDGDALKAQSAAEHTAAQSLDLARRQRRLGAVGDLAVLNAEYAWRSAVLARVRAQAARFSDTAALFQALGGGWWNRDDPGRASLAPPGVIYAPPLDRIHRP